MITDFILLGTWLETHMRCYQQGAGLGRVVQLRGSASFPASPGLFFCSRCAPPPHTGAFPSATPTCLETGSIEASPLPAASYPGTRGSFSNERLLIFFFFMKTSLAQPIKIAQNIPGLGETGQCPAPSRRHPCCPFLAFPLDLIYKFWSG